MPLDLGYVAHAAEITDEELIAAFATLMAAMHERGIIRTRNVVGDLGERYAVRAYHARRPLTLADPNEPDVDAFDSNRTSFAIKTASPSSTRTSAFHLEETRSRSEKAFDYLIVVRVNDLLQPVRVYELTWEQFFDAKPWSKRQKAWFLPLTKKVLKAAVVVPPQSLAAG